MGHWSDTIFIWISHAVGENYYLEFTILARLDLIYQLNIELATQEESYLFVNFNSISRADSDVCQTSESVSDIEIWLNSIVTSKQPMPSFRILTNINM